MKGSNYQIKKCILVQKYLYRNSYPSFGHDMDPDLVHDGSAAKDITIYRVSYWIFYGGTAVTHIVGVYQVTFVAIGHGLTWVYALQGVPLF